MTSGYKPDMQKPVPATLYRFFHLDPPEKQPREHSPGFALLLKRRLLFSNPAEFNDPFDCLPSYHDFIKGQMKEREFARKLALESVGDAPRPIQESTRKGIERKTRLDHPLKYRNELGDVLRVVCFSETHRNNLMWSHYARSHRGFVAEFDCGHEFFRDGLFPVIYTSTRPRVDTASDEELLFSKSPEWEYEKEWRMVRPLAALRQSPNDGPRFTELPPRTIRRFFVGMCTTDEYRRLLGIHARKFGAEIVQMVPATNSFDLEDWQFEE